MEIFLLTNVFILPNFSDKPILPNLQILLYPWLQMSDTRLLSLIMSAFDLMKWRNKNKANESDKF